jgi:MoaA/NifB/PqqE/SkfB family radical SAM enzyme
MDTNHLCNQSCRMCYFSSPDEIPVKQLPLSLYKKIAGEVFPKTRVLFLSCYAEPFCSKDILEFIRIAKYDYYIPFVSLTTNGNLINRSVAEKLPDSGIDEIVFSIAGGQKETYEYIQRGASWETLWENIQNLAEIKKKHGSPTPELRANYILNKKSVHEVSSIAPLFVKNGISSVNVRELIPFRNIDMDFYRDFKLTSHDDKLVANVYREFKLAGIKTIDSFQCSKYDKISISRNYPCILPFFSLFINPDARVKFCLFRNWEYSLEQSFEEITKSKEHTQFLKTLKKRSTANCVHDCEMFAIKEPIQ